MNNNNNEKNHHLRRILSCDYCNSEKHISILKSKDYVYNVIPGEFTIVRCSNCNLVFTNPRIESEDLINYYSRIVSYGEAPINLNIKADSSFFLRKDILTDYFNYPILEKSLKRKLIQFPNYLRLRRWWKNTLFIPPYIENGSVLEVGCSYGGHLSRLKGLGWKVKGIELSEKAVDYTRNVLKLDVEKNRIEDFQSDMLFDIIYLYMVLEHIESPKATLKKLYSLLKPNGKLVLSVPDMSGIEVRLYKKYAYTLQVPLHLYHFTPTTIKNYLKDSNFKKIEIIHLNFDRDLVAPLNYILKENPNKILVKIAHIFCKNKLFRKTIIKLIVRVLAFLGKTSRMIIIAKK